MNFLSSDLASDGRPGAGSANSLGDQLRRAREARSTSLREISEQTRISLRFLEAIEINDYKSLPGGIFNRSFIKSYARVVGFDEHEALEAYARTAREQGIASDEQVATIHQPRVYTDNNSMRSPLVTILVSLAVLAILSLGVYAALRGYQRRVALRTQTAASADGAATNNQTPSQQTVSSPVTTTPAASSIFNVEVKSRGERVWIRTRSDEGESTELILNPNDVKNFAPERRLNLEFYKGKAAALQLTINGRPAKVLADGPGQLAQMVITRDGFQQLLQ
ncbi:MAG: helix-turn-helix domain-containing protein [Pyrinomonadaceae bacterium]|nr:helix-turn-helix domain-containing protein [Pyrinomonadaceae bacterium]